MYRRYKMENNTAELNRKSDSSNKIQNENGNGNITDTDASLAANLIEAAKSKAGEIIGVQKSGALDDKNDQVGEINGIHQSGAMDNKSDQSGEGKKLTNQQPHDSTSNQSKESTDQQGQNSTNNQSKDSTNQQAENSRNNQSEEQSKKKEEEKFDPEWTEFIDIDQLKEEALLSKMKKFIEALEKMENHDNEKALSLFKAIRRCHSKYQTKLKKITGIFCETNFAELCIKIILEHNTKGIFKNDLIWFPTYYLHQILWNYTDCSLVFAQKVGEAGGVPIFTANCNHQPFLAAIKSKNVLNVIKSSMSILQNVARATGVHQYFKDSKTSEVMLNYLNNYAEDNDAMLKVLAMMILSHIVDEEDNDKLMDNTGAINQMISYISSALKNAPKYRFKGFSIHEIIDGLAKLAVNDKNKKKIIDAGALPVFLQILKGKNDDDKSMTARVIWTLSFDKDVCKAIVEFEDMMPTLEQLKDSTNKDVGKNVKGALFVLTGQNEVSNRPRSAINKRHIFLSYSWNEKDIIYELKDRLKAEGFTVWIDVEKMGGSTLEAMAEAVENSSVVLIGMSEKYKQSPNCRLEAEYAIKLQKNYIPLMMQKKYRPDGWLGIILGAKLYFDFSGKYQIQKPWQGLLKELKSLEHVDQMKSSNTSMLTAQPTRNYDDTTDSPDVIPSHHSTFRAPPVGHEVTISQESLKMTRKQVSDWMCKNKLDRCLEHVDSFDGELLYELKCMKAEAPEFYYQSLKTDFGMTMVEILRFTAALKKL